MSSGYFIFAHSVVWFSREKVFKKFMSTLQDSQYNDRELFSELNESPINDWELFSELNESPINPAHLHMCVPKIGGNDPLYRLQINGQALWKWTSLKGNADRIFSSLQISLSKLGFQLSDSSCKRIGGNLAVKIRQFVKYTNSTASNNDARKRIRANSWKTLEIRPEEICQVPADYLRQLKESESKLQDENARLEKESSFLYQQMLAQKKTQDLRHKGKAFGEVGRRQQQRQLTSLRSKAEKALWFAESYGLLPKSLEMESATGQNIQLKFSGSSVNEGEVTSHENAISETSNEECSKEAYVKLNEEEKVKIRSLLYILDRFSISLRGYHELTQIHESLPRTHYLESCAKVLDSKWEVTRTPGEAPGAELPIKLLLEKEIQQHMKANPEAEKLRIKISGDGAKMSHSSNMFVLSFAILEKEKSCLSSSGNHTVACVKTDENYVGLKSSLSNVIKDVNTLTEDGHLIVDGKEIELEFYLGGDYKLLLIAMGMKGATSNNSCIWCTLHRLQRCDMSKSCSDFLELPLARSLTSQWYKQPGCHSQPFFDIKLENVVIDELHLMLRVTDRLEEGLIRDVIQWDEDDNESKPRNQRKQAHLTAFISSVRSLGVSLRVYYKDGKWDWTSLLGGEKRVLLEKLPHLFEKFLPPCKIQPTRSLWMNFKELLDLLNRDDIDAEIINIFEKKAVDWGKEMVKLSGTGPGYMHTVIITPYMHILIYHIPTMLRRHGSLKIFSGQGVEKKNDDFRRYFHRKINRWDASANLLLVEKRQEELREHGREKRKYTKRNASFWLDGGKLEVPKKVTRISTVTHQDPVLPATSTPPPPPETQLNELRKMKVPELIAILEQATGKVMHQKTRKAMLIDAIIQSRMS